jgi:hypothetical protein
MLRFVFSSLVIKTKEVINTTTVKTIPKVTFLNHFMLKIIAIVIKIIESKVADLLTHMVEKSRVEVKTEPKNEPIVEKNKSFQIFSQAFSHSKISDNRGIVWLA